MLEGYVKSLQFDHKSAVFSLKSALKVLKMGQKQENLGLFEEAGWPLRVKIVLLYNVSVESMNIHLRNDAIDYVSKAENAVSLYKTGLSGFSSRIDTLKTALLKGKRRDLSDDSQENEGKTGKIRGIRPISQRLRRVETESCLEKEEKRGKLRPLTSVRGKLVVRSQSKLRS